MDLQLADDTATQLWQVSELGRTGVVSVLEKFSDASIAQNTPAGPRVKSPETPLNSASRLDLLQGW